MSGPAGPARATPADRWIRPLGPGGATARLRLFCFHYAGGSPSMFRTWPRLLPPGVSVEPVLLPGRDARFRERPYDRMAPLVEAVTQALRPRIDRPYALFGYSMGAQVAFQVAHAVRRAGLPSRPRSSSERVPGPLCGARCRPGTSPTNTSSPICVTSAEHLSTCSTTPTCWP